MNWSAFGEQIRKRGRTNKTDIILLNITKGKEPFLQLFVRAKRALMCFLPCGFRLEL